MITFLRTYYTICTKYSFTNCLKFKRQINNYEAILTDLENHNKESKNLLCEGVKPWISLEGAGGHLSQTPVSKRCQTRYMVWGFSKNVTSYAGNIKRSFPWRYFIQRWSKDIKLFSAILSNSVIEFQLKFLKDWEIYANVQITHRFLGGKELLIHFIFC